MRAFQSNLGLKNNLLRSGPLQKGINLCEETWSFTHWSTNFAAFTAPQGKWGKTGHSLGSLFPELPSSSRKAVPLCHCCRDYRPPPWWGRGGLASPGAYNGPRSPKHLLVQHHTASINLEKEQKDRFSKKILYSSVIPWRHVDKHLFFHWIAAVHGFFMKPSHINIRTFS